MFEEGFYSCWQKARTILQIFTWATLRFSFLKMFTENVI